MSKETTQPGTPISLTFEQLKELLASAQKQPNVIEQKRIDEEIEKERKRDLAQAQLAKIEQEAMEEKKRRCSHTRYPMAMGARGGHLAPKGQGEWITSGQCHSPKLATLICMRCSYTWNFEPTTAEFEQITQSGMIGWAPPDQSRILSESVAGA